MAGTSRPWSSRRGRGGEGRLLVAQHDRHDRRRVARAAARSTWARRRATELRRPRPSAGRRSAARAAAASAGVGAVVKMKGRARLTSRSTNGGGPGDEAAQRAEGLRQRADRAGRSAPDRRARRGRARRGPRRARAGRRGGAQRGQLVDAAHVAVHGEHGVGDDDRPVRAAPAGRPAGRGRRGGRRATSARRQPAAVDDRGVVELVAEQTRDAGPAERGEDAEVGGEAGGEEDGAAPGPSRRPARLELGVDRAGADDRAGPSRCRRPSGRGRRGRRRPRRGAGVRPR